MKLIADILSMQDPDKPHTLLTRMVVSLIIVGTSVVYAGFFGVIGAVGVYLVFVELMNLDLSWLYAPIVVAIIVGLTSSLRMLTDYWRNYGHG